MNTERAVSKQCADKVLPAIRPVIQPGRKGARLDFGWGCLRKRASCSLFTLAGQILFTNLAPERAGL